MPPRALWRSGLVSCLAALIACAGTSNRPSNAANPPAPHVMTALGYHEVVEQGVSFARNQGFSDAELEEVTSIGPNLWRLRFGLPKESGKLLEIEVDGTLQQLIRVQQVQRLGIAAGLKPHEARDGG